MNGILSAGRNGTTNFTAYISPYLVLNNGGYYSKHIYMGSQRIVSKLGSSDIFAASPLDAAKAGSGIDYAAKLADQTAKIKSRYDSLGVAYKGTPQGSTGLITSEASKIATPQKYFYHSDHLGSSSLITDALGNVSQHLEYVPFGEVFVEERNSNWSTPYRFNGKEQDEETGLCYYGARYYDPKTSVWLSVDPLAEKYPNVSSYIYCHNNPVNMIDPDGRDGKESGTGTKDDPVTIKANYYYQKNSLSKDQKFGLNAAIAAYNNNGKAREIKNDNNEKIFVKFELAAVEVENVANSIDGDIFTTENGDPVSFGNIIGLKPNGENQKECGSANGWRVDLNADNINNEVEKNGYNLTELIKGTFIHEIGHNLGLDHDNKTDIMIQNKADTFSSQTGGSNTIYTYPQVDKAGVKILINSTDKPRVKTLGVLKR